MASAPAASAAAKGSGPPAGAKSSGLRLVVRLAVAVISCLSKCSDTQKYSGAVAMGDARSLSRTKSSAASRAKMIRFPLSPMDRLIRWGRRETDHFELHCPVVPFSGRQAPLGDKIFSQRDNNLASRGNLEYYPKSSAVFRPNCASRCERRAHALYLIVRRKT